MKTVYYKTDWRQGTKKGSYITKSLTNFHKEIHKSDKTDHAITYKCDPNVDWVFGLWAEVIAITSKKFPKENKPFNN